MKKKSTVAFHHSDLGRAKPKRHFLKTFVNDKLKQPRRLHSDTGMVIDRTNPSVAIRIILCLIVLHLLIIGGVMMRGNISKSNSGMAVAPTITPPPAMPAPAEAPAPVQPTAVAATTTPAPEAQAQNQTQVHITQSPINVEAVTPVAAQPAPPVAPVVVQPAPAPAQPAVPTTEIKHLIQSGDTWGRIAAKYNVSEDVLKGANAQLANMTNLPGGTYLTVVVPADSAHAQAAQASKPVVQETAKYHVVKSGENLGRIAAKYKITLSKLLKLNNMTNADARRLQIGQKLKVSE